MHLTKFLADNKNYNHNLKKHDFYNLSKVILAISDTAIEISKLIYSPKSKDLGKITGRQNTDGDLTKSLDLKADEIIKQKLKNNYVKWYASEEEEEILLLYEEGSFAICVDPLDGSTNASRGVPWFATSLCAVDGEGPWVAVVADLVSGTRYDAVRGWGARRDGQEIEREGIYGY